MRGGAGPYYQGAFITTLAGYSDFCCGRSAVGLGGWSYDVADTNGADCTSEALLQLCSICGPLGAVSRRPLRCFTSCSVTAQHLGALCLSLGLRSYAQMLSKLSRMRLRDLALASRAAIAAFAVGRSVRGPLGLDGI